MKGKNVLIIEDTLDDYQRLFNNLPNYSCFPRNREEFSQIKRHLINFSTRESNSEAQNREENAKIYFNNYFKEKIFDAIILDINLLSTNDEDTSGLEFLKYLRRFYRITPIIMLTRFTIDKVRVGLMEADGMANYYLHKGGEKGYLSDNFFINQLNPILSMLIYWKETTTPENIINTAIDKHESKLIEQIEIHFGRLEIKLNQSLSDIDELKRYANCTLGILRYHTKIDDKKAGELADKLINEYKFSDNVPKLEENKEKISEFLITIRDEIIGIIKGEVKKDLSDFLESNLRTFLNLEDDDNLTWEITKILYNFSHKHIKMLLV